MASRRAFLALTLYAVRFALAASEFWNRKEPAQWSSDEIRQLLTRSPWAKNVRVVMLASNPNRYGHETGPVTDPAGISRGGLADGTGGGNIGPGGDGVKRGQRDGVPADALAVTVRWESAFPVLAALNRRLPDAFAARYVVGLTSFPMLGPHDDMVDTLRSTASLQAKGKEPVQPGVVQLAKDGSEVLFGFSRELFPLTAADRDLVFSLDTREVSLRAKFEPSEMMYRGQFAI